uniref:Ig-like domain-containing protein n=1 Tax=Myotis lucifugus TaxID=59463 RepID=G1Q5X4_MYOLU
MVLLLLLPCCWGGSLQQLPGYEVRVQESVTVQEGLCVHVPCSFSYPGSPWSSPSELYTYWYRDGDNTNRDAPVASSNRNKTVKRETRGRFLLADPTTNNCSLRIIDARRSDSGRYVFRVERGGSVKYNYQRKKLDLQVAALTEKPHIRVREPLESGRPTQLACSLPGACEGGRPLTFSWAGASVDSLDPQNLSSSVLTFTPRPRDHGTSLTCQVKREGSQRTTQRTIRLNVSYAPQNLTIGVSFRNYPGKAVPQAGAVPAALGGAGAVALLSLCLCLIFLCIVKARRRQAAGRPKVRNDEEPVMGTGTWGSQKNLQPDGPPDQASPAEKGPLSGKQKELYYANLTFEGLKPREPRGQEATSTQEY